MDGADRRDQLRGDRSLRQVARAAGGQDLACQVGGELVVARRDPVALADAILELLTGWYQEMNMPKAYGTMEIEYHCPRPGRLHRGKNEGDGAGDPGPDNCLLSAQK